MLFTSPLFLFIFFPVVVVLYWLQPKWTRNIFLLLASLFFYAWGEAYYVFALIGIVVINYLFGLVIERVSFKKAALAVAVAFDLGCLIYFKYFGLLISLLNHFIVHVHMAALPTPTVHMPLGISFVTFHIISYCIDTYRKKISAEKNPLNFALYVFLFPHLIAGPIVRYSSIGQQIKHREESTEKAAYGMYRFVTGLAKKMLIANTVGSVVDTIYALKPFQLTPLLLWFAMLLYALQIYFDFSGYSDMAIGLASLFGFTFAENFNYPYISKSIQEFWRRWHMTLSSWFRDYLYIPLGGNRKGQVRTAINLLIVFGLTGLWHGANFRFFLWGLYYGIFLVLERTIFGTILRKLWLPLQHLYALLVIGFGWILFRIDSLSYAEFIYKKMFNLGPPSFPSYSIWSFLSPYLVIVIILGCLFSTPIVFALQQRVKQCISHRSKTVVPSLRIGYDMVGLISLIVLFGICAVTVASSTYNPFIYFRF